MKKIIIALVILVAVAIGTYYSVFNKSSDSRIPSAPNNQKIITPAPVTQPQTKPTPPPTPISNTPKTLAPLNITVDIRNFSFNPSTLTIKAGMQITWVNNDTVPHTVVSDSGAIFHSPTLSPGQSFSFAFTNPGSINYHCGIHPTMKGNIIIQN